MLVLNKEKIEDILNEEFTKLIVYIIEDKMVGYINYSLIYERGEINYIFVDENYRNKKIASLLIEYMIMNSNVKTFSLEVNVNNYKAINLYNKYNFKNVALRKNYYNGEDGFLMVRGE